MIKKRDFSIPGKRDNIKIRIIIFLGLLCIINFFYHFFKPELIENPFLYWLLFTTFTYDGLKIIYLWYHYWDASVPKKPVLSKKLVVDVFTTYFPGEPYEMVKETLLAIQKIKYPHTTYLCDEANDPYLIEFCKSNGIIHVTRNNRVDAKAGNINNALLQATGDICLILDPDHIPKENFLDEVVPYFEDDKIGFVQTVQAYYNIEESSVARGAAQQTFHFYGPLMKTMNSYGTVNAIGANCVFRRKALDSIGGHAPGLSEDMHTAMKLHAKGWKSVYVPKSLTKGLVPASLTAYYKQQLKWSRGTLELLLVTYPKLFKKFSWRQKLHYAILPLYYLSGIILLINFLIPIISLFTATMPWKGNLLNFGLIFTPVLLSIFGIRYYIQNWLIHKSERGIHLTGGLLLASTWWIYIIGLIYTIIRKKVLYLPTPKENNHKTSWKLLIPNLTVGVTSIFAVIYGLSIDFTPFTIFMSGFALLNAFFMFYTLVFAYQKQKTISYQFASKEKKLYKTKKIQNFGFHLWRRLALPIVLITILLFTAVSFYPKYSESNNISVEVQKKNYIDYIGIFAPIKDNGITDLKNVQQTSAQTGINFDIISLYMPWNKRIEFKFPQTLLDSIYNQKSIPMITWEPWLHSFESEINTEKHVFDLIEEGYLDYYIEEFSKKLKNLEKPVFLRFAHEFDNPFYPWYISGKSDPTRFKRAWIHVYEIFKKNNANNVIWVWNPWQPMNVISFYPGEEYVDWIGVNVLNYGNLNQDGKEHRFDTIYKSFHDEFINLPSTPVMISEFGTLQKGISQNNWINDAFSSIENDYSEIKSVVFFNSKFDNNWPTELPKSEYLDWSLSNNYSFKASIKRKQVPDYFTSSIPKLNVIINYTNVLTSGTTELTNIKGINLKKGQNWRDDYHVLNRKNLINDFKKIKNLGINTIKYKGNSVYDYNVLNITKEFDLKVSYGFSIPSYIDFINDTIISEQLKQTILDRIRKNIHYKNISSWNIQNDVLHNQTNFYPKPELFFQNNAYIIWLTDIVKKIKEIDAERPIIVDLVVGFQSVNNSIKLLANIQEIDALGLVVTEDKYLDYLMTYLKQSKIKFVFSNIGVKDFEQHNIIDSGKSFFIEAWQDRYETNKLTFDGLIDRKGRYKIEYFKLLNTIKKSSIKVTTPIVRILKPSTLVVENNILDFFAMHYDKTEGWKRGEEMSDLIFEWSLVKCDKYGNYLSIEDIGNGPKLSLKIPRNYKFYRLLLTTSKEGIITTSTISTLNTPLIQNEERLN